MSSEPAAAPTALARNQAARRRRVIDATLSLAAGGGFDAVQMRDVAAEAGVALGTVYRYFESKERLLLEANLEQVEALGRRLARAPARRVRRRPTGSSTCCGGRATRCRRRPEATAAMVRALGLGAAEEADAVARVSAGDDRDHHRRDAPGRAARARPRGGPGAEPGLAVVAHRLGRRRRRPDAWSTTSSPPPAC